MLSSEVVVALALGIPSLFVALAALWIAYLTYIKQSPSVAATHVAAPTWPSQQHPPLDPDDNRIVFRPQAMFPGAPPLRRRPVDG
ncbi:hypothetical protein PG987_016538 [Apiospora arundinis]